MAPDLVAMAFQRIFSRVQITDGCWIWPGWANAGGYGQIRVGKRQRAGVHRLVYELTNGCRLNGYDLHHRCEEPHCINPDHLQPMRPGKHQSDQHGLRRVACGHEHILGAVHRRLRNGLECYICRAEKGRVQRQQEAAAKGRSLRQNNSRWLRVEGQAVVGGAPKSKIL